MEGRPLPSLDVDLFKALPDKMPSISFTDNGTNTLGPRRCIPTPQGEEVFIWEAHGKQVVLLNYLPIYPLSLVGVPTPPWPLP